MATFSLLFTLFNGLLPGFRLAGETLLFIFLLFRKSLLLLSVTHMAGGGNRGVDLDRGGVLPGNLFSMRIARPGDNDCLLLFSVGGNLAGNLVGLEVKFVFVFRMDFIFSGDGSREPWRDGRVESRKVRILNGLARPLGDGERDLIGTGGLTSGRMTKAPLSLRFT